MFGFVSKFVETAVDVVTLPVSVVADVVTMGGALNEREQPYTVDKAGRILRNATDAVQKVGRVDAAMTSLVAFIREWLWPSLPDDAPVWRVDRDGRVYLPERRVILRAKNNA